MIRSLLIFLLLCASPTTFAVDGTPRARFVELAFDIVQEGRELGSPKVVAEIGSESRMQSDQSGRAYRLQFTVEEVFLDDHGRALAKIALQWMKPNGSEWKLVSAPTTVIELGAPAATVHIEGDSVAMLGIAARIISARDLDQ
jgi:hypothetical protein